MAGKKTSPRGKSAPSNGRKPLLVEKISDGTVIDRIDAGKGWRVLAMLGLNSGAPQGRIALVVNVPSRHMGKKDILKIEGVYVEPKMANKIALISPQARLNIIKGSKVSKKLDVFLPDNVAGIGKCPNPKCISNSEKIETGFSRRDHHLRCRFCERLFNAEELV